MEDGYDGVGPAAKWFKRYSLSETEATVEKALLSLPPDVIAGQSQVWIEAFRAGASNRFDQIASYSLRRAIPGRMLLVVALMVAAGLVSAARAGRL